jgi:SPP1 family predicted phage head-tail adaptor
MSHANIGEMRHRLTLEAPQRTADGGGGAIVTWTLIADVWGAVVPLSGSESLEADGLKGRVTHQISIRYRPGISPEMRFVLGTRRFDIRAVVDRDEHRRFLRCLVEEQVL